MKNISSHFDGLDTTMVEPLEVSRALHLRQMPTSRLGELAPVVLAVCEEDAVAAGIEAVRALAQAGLQVGISCSPVIPGITDSTTDLESLVRTAAEAGFLGDSVNFRVPLSGALNSSHVHFIEAGGAPTAECPGTHTAPAAASGNLCVYETFHSGSTLQGILPSSIGVGSGSDAWGFDIYFVASGTKGVWDFGTWAVTG